MSFSDIIKFENRTEMNVCAMCCRVEEPMYARSPGRLACVSGLCMRASGQSGAYEGRPSLRAGSPPGRGLPAPGPGSMSRTAFV